jgi:hypothetical protein
MSRYEESDMNPISKPIPEENLPHYLWNRSILMALSEMNDLFIKINNGSIDITDEFHYKELFLEKIRNNSFLFKGEGKTTIINWITISFLFIKFNKPDLIELIDIINESDNDSKFIIPLYKKFGRASKEDIVHKLLDGSLDEIKQEGRWQAIRKATFVLFFMAKCYTKDRISEAKKEYEFAIEEFEKNTGIDANYNSLQRHTDRFTRNQHFNGKKKKQKNN